MGTWKDKLRAKRYRIENKHSIDYQRKLSKVKRRINPILGGRKNVVRKFFDSRKEWVLRNKDKIREYQQMWYVSNRERILTDKKKYYVENKKKIHLKNVKKKLLKKRLAIKLLKNLNSTTQ